MKHVLIYRLFSIGIVLQLMPAASLLAQGAPYETIRLTPDALSVAPTPVNAPALDPVDAKLHAQLRAALDVRARGVADTSGLPASLRGGDQVLVEVHLTAESMEASAGILRNHGASVRNMLSAGMCEAWMPLERLRELATDAAVVRIMPARLVRHLIGSKTSEGVAAGNANYWQTFNPGYTGTGITIALIDSFNNIANQIGALQTSGDWPPAARLTKIDKKNFPMGQVPSSCTVETFGCAGDSHGNATMEIVYDVAPGATYRAYDTVTVGDWYNSILDAANVNSSGTSLGAVKANVISASLAAPLDGIGDGTAQAGSIAQAAGFAKNKGVLVVNAAGNERQNHWGGLFHSTGSMGFHAWDGASAIYNPFVNVSNQQVCVPNGDQIDVELFWNDWPTPVTHNYGIYLYELGTSSTWQPVANSDCTQYNACETPQALIQYQTAGGATAGCPSGTAVYAVAVVREAGTTTSDNLQVFASVADAGVRLQFFVTARSLDFPADSPNVLSVAAIDVANMTTTPQEPFSSEGPVLAAGGAIPTTSAATDPNLKPDLASFDHVTTVTYGASAFYGTSAATPHAAGMAALFMQRFGIQTSATNLTNVILAPLRAIAATGSNDLGTVGKDYQYGNGRLRFQKDAAVAFIQQPTNAAANAAIAPAIKVGIYDSESKLVPYTLFDTLTLAIGNDPNGGSAVLSGGGSANLTAGVATWSAAKISLGGTGYTLAATATAPTTPPINLAVTSTPFNITTGAPSKLVFSVQPSNVRAGVVMSPAVRVTVEDANNNIVNSDSTTKVALVRSSCSSIVPVGGAQVTVTNGVATFAGLTLYTVGSGATLTATATGLSSAISTSFAVTANTNFIFRNSFETCSP